VDAVAILIEELRSGVRREGAFFGVNALLTKPAQSVAWCRFVV